MPAATIALLGDNGSGTLARVEATAAGGAIRVGLAWAGDELCACCSSGYVGGVNAEGHCEQTDWLENIYHCSMGDQRTESKSEDNGELHGD